MIKKIIKGIVPISFFRIYYSIKRIKLLYYDPLKPSFWGSKGVNSMIMTPVEVDNPKRVFFAENTKLQPNSHIVNNKCGLIMKRNSAAAVNLTVVTMNHKSTVGVPHFLLGASHINDREKDIIVEEDCWVGSNVTLLYGAHLGRGCIVGANSMVNKEIPPYALVVGSPAKIIGVKFTLEQAIEHEKKIYKPEDRMAVESLTKLFKENYEGLRVFGTDSFTDQDAIQIERTKKRLRFIEQV